MFCSYTINNKINHNNTEKLKISKENTIIINNRFETSISDVFAGGDCTTGSKSVVEAVAHGKFIADQINSIFLSKGSSKSLN